MSVPEKGTGYGIVLDVNKKSYHYLDPNRIPIDGDVIATVLWPCGEIYKYPLSLLEHALYLNSGEEDGK